MSSAQRCNKRGGSVALSAFPAPTRPYQTGPTTHRQRRGMQQNSEAIGCTDPPRENCPVVARGRNSARSRWRRVRRKWVQHKASQNPPDAEGEAADTSHRPQAADGRLSQKEMIVVTVEAREGDAQEEV